MISLKKINDEKVKPIKLKKIDQKNIKCFNMFPNHLGNAYIMSKKASGKTTTIFNMLKKCTNKNTTVHIFCSTIYKDASYKEIIKYLDKKGITYDLHTSIMDNGVNELTEILKDLEVEEDSDDSSSSEKEDIRPKLKYINFGYCEEEEEMKVYKPKLICPKHIFLFDDISNELKNPAISFLLKRNRHFKAMTIISSQYLHDLRPESISQLDYMLVFKGIPEEKLKIIHSNLDLSIDLETFKQLYYTATEEKYNFLYISVRDDTFRKNFNMKFQIE